MPDHLTIVAKYGTPEEAHLIRNRLESSGIRAFLDGEVTSGWAWHFANALGGVKVLVPDQDAERAAAILDEFDEEAGDEADAWDARRAAALTWTCPGCGSEVEVDLDVCPACGVAADGPAAGAESHEDHAAEAAEDQAPAPDVAFFTVLFPPTLMYFFFTKLCAALGPLVPDVRRAAPVAQRESEPASEGAPAPAEEEVDARALDALVVRAWRAALIGVFMFPPLLFPLYSIGLLTTFWLRREAGNASRDRRALAALAVDLVVVVLAGWLIWLAFGDWISRAWPDPTVIGPVEPEAPSDLGR